MMLKVHQVILMRTKNDSNNIETLHNCLWGEMVTISSYMEYTPTNVKRYVNILGQFLYLKNATSSRNGIVGILLNPCFLDIFISSEDLALGADGNYVFGNFWRMQLVNSDH